MAEQETDFFCSKNKDKRQWEWFSNTGMLQHISYLMDMPIFYGKQGLTVFLNIVLSFIFSEYCS